MAKVKNTWIGAALDESGSMSHLRSDTIGGFNSWLEEIRKTDDDKTNLLGITFDSGGGATDNVRVIADKPLSEWSPITEDDYLPRGMTPLLDAVHYLITSIEKKMGKKDRALVLVMTDGQENASREITAEQLKAKVAELEATDRWTFVYIGATLDAFNAATSYGLHTNSAMSVNTAVGSTKLYTNATAGTVNYLRQTNMTSTKQFLTDEQKKDLVEP